MKRSTLLAATALALVAPGVQANNLTINQDNLNTGAQIRNLTIQQATGGSNTASITVQGGLDTLVIEQRGLNDAVSLAYYGAADDTLDSRYSVSIDSGTSVNTAVGTPETAPEQRTTRMDYELSVVGTKAGSTVDDTFAAGPDLFYRGRLFGNGFDIDVTSGNTDTSATQTVLYSFGNADWADTTGKLDINLGFAGGDRRVEVLQGGNGNDIDIDAFAANGDVYVNIYDEGSTDLDIYQSGDAIGSRARYTNRVAGTAARVTIGQSGGGSVDVSADYVANGQINIQQTEMTNAFSSVNLKATLSGTDRIDIRQAAANTVIETVSVYNADSSGTEAGVVDIDQLASGATLAGLSLTTQSAGILTMTQDTGAQKSQIAKSSIDVFDSAAVTLVQQGAEQSIDGLMLTATTGSTVNMTQTSMAVGARIGPSEITVGPGATLNVTQGTQGALLTMQMALAGGATHTIAQ